MPTNRFYRLKQYLLPPGLAVPAPVRLLCDPLERFAALLRPRELAIAAVPLDKLLGTRIEGLGTIGHRSDAITIPCILCHVILA
jgi:hypothetical protein